MNLTNEHEFSEWVKTIVAAKVIPTAAYKDREYLEQNISDIADVVVHGWIKANIKEYLAEDGYLGSLMLSHMDDMTGLRESVVNAANTGAPAYRFDASKVPASLTAALNGAVKTARFRAIKDIRKQLAVPEFKLDMKMLRTNLPDFASTMVFARGRAGEHHPAEWMQNGNENG